jgi:hypothetical protein
MNALVDGPVKVADVEAACHAGPTASPQAMLARAARTGDQREKISGSPGVFRTFGVTGTEKRVNYWSISLLDILKWK